MLTYTMEDYVETIYRLQTRRGYACVTDIAGYLGVKPPSVSRMLGKLARKNLVVYEKYRGVVLTDEGLLVGRFLLERHLLLTRLLEVIGLQDASEKMVEGIEHFISAENLRRVKYFLEMAEQYPGVFAGSREE